MKFVRFGLIARIALLVVGVEAAAFSLLGWFYVDRLSSAITEQTYARLHLVGQMIAHDELAISTLSRPPLMTNLLGAPYLDGMAIGGSNRVIVSTDPAYLGRRSDDVPGFDPAWIGEAAPQEQVIPGKGRLTSVIHVSSAAEGQDMYYIVMTISTAEIDAMKHSLMLWGLFGSLVFILLSSAGIILIAQRLISRRVNSSLAVLKAVEDGNLDARVPVSSNDELGELQSGINSMIGKVGMLLNQHRLNSEAMQKQKELLESIIQHAPLRVFWKDSELRYLGCNGQFAADAGLVSPGDLIGKTDFEMGWRDQAERYRADDRAVMALGEAKLDFEEPQTTPDGRTIWLSTSKVPLRGEDGAIIGVLGIYSDITARKEAEAQIHSLAYFDPLTGLPNRRLLLDRLHQAMAGTRRNGQYGALFMLDLDNFKELNDTQGHLVGDQLLVEVSRRLTGNVREIDTVARLGGDEYIVVSEGLGVDEAVAAVQAREIGEKLRLALGHPYALRDDRPPHYSTASLGVTLFRGDEVPTDVLLKQADVALYQAKNAGRNAVRFFSTAMQAAIDERARMAAGLHAGLEKGEFRLYYQPQVDQHGRLVGAEALLRWLPHDADPVSPAQFIPVAEETGLIIPIGAWVLEEACLQLRRWQRDEATRDLTLAINVSARQFHQHDFVDLVSERVRLAGIDPGRLKLELTESVVLSHVDEVVGRMHRLKELGVSFSLDDFGTGFSSLAYLNRLPLDQVKIDQSFIRDIPNNRNGAAIVRAILAMSRSLGLEVIAEGVETEAQRTYLEENGCGHYQGYLFGRPMPIEQWPSLPTLGPGG